VIVLNAELRESSRKAYLQLNGRWHAGERMAEKRKSGQQLTSSGKPAFLIVLHPIYRARGVDIFPSCLVVRYVIVMSRVTRK
jgi:hypothetical protein